MRSGGTLSLGRAPVKVTKMFGGRAIGGGGYGGKRKETRSANPLCYSKVHAGCTWWCGGVGMWWSGILLSTALVLKRLEGSDFDSRRVE